MSFLMDKYLMVAMDTVTCGGLCQSIGEDNSKGHNKSRQTKASKSSPGFTHNSGENEVTPGSDHLTSPYGYICDTDQSSGTSKP